MIKKGIEEGLKPLNKELSDIKEVMQYITINKRSIRPVNARRLIAMVVSLEKRQYSRPNDHQHVRGIRYHRVS